MKIILREHVEHLGERGDVVRVAAGYARNYLLPKGLAYPAGEGSARQLQDQTRAWAARESRDESAAAALGAQVSALRLEARRRAGDTGTLYGSVTNGDVAELLAKAGIEIDRRKIQLQEPIKSLGDFQVRVKLHRNVAAEVPLTVLTERGQSLADLQAYRAKLDSESVVAGDDDERRGREEPAEANEAAAESAAEDEATETPGD